MRWKSVALAVSLLPACAGCGSVRNWAAEVVAANSLRPVTGAPPGGAPVSIPRAGEDRTRAAYTDEFRDGFFDGYVESLDRGTPAPRPALPPMKYARDGKYQTADGQRLVRDYYLGFQYGAEAAAGKEGRGVTVVPEQPEPGSPLAAPRPVSPGALKLPKPEVPVIPPFDPPLPGGKFAPFPSLDPPPKPDLVPVPKPPLPTEPLPVPPVAPASFSAPADAPPLPSVLEDIAPVPFVPPPPGK